MENWKDRIKDPNIQFASSSPGYDPAKPMKSWIDTRATDPANTDEQFLYKIFAKPARLDSKGDFVKVMVVLSRADAATPNIPPPGDESKSRAGDIDFPVRDLLPGEKIIIDPFGRVIDISGNVAAGDLSRIESKIDRILAAVEKSS